MSLVEIYLLHFFNYILAIRHLRFQLIYNFFAKKALVFDATVTVLIGLFLVLSGRLVFVGVVQPVL